ncbi:hypothetical protein HDU99_010051, partial [Rhizoclosmatium hyalinum]
MEEEDPACASPATLEQPRGTPKPTGFSNPSRIDSMQEDFAIDSRRFEQVGNREDQMEKELEHGIDEMGRFLPLDDFAGTYKVIYPYLEKLKDDEIKLSKGDIVEVSVSYVDGWAKGHNLTTREKGFVPLHCLCPELNATIEEGRILGKWFNRSLSHQVEVPSDWKYLCKHETRHLLTKEMLGSYKPVGASGGIDMPPAAHIGVGHKRIASTWIEGERCHLCYSQAAPE